MATTTPDDLKRNQSEFEDSFNQADVPRAEQTEDEAFGLDIKNADEPASDVASTSPAQGMSDSAADGEPIDAVVVVADGDAVGDAVGKATAKATAAEASASQSQENADEPTDPKDIQRKKSWEGRLKAEEARLKALAQEIEAKAAASGEAPQDVAAETLEDVAGQAEDQGDTTMAEKVEEVADKVEDGEISIDEAMSMLSADFGEPFVKMISAIAKSAAKEIAGAEIGEIKKTTSDIIDHLKSSAAKAHFKAIQDAHPDFAEISSDPSFQEWRDADPERVRVASGGSAEEVNAMLDQWKAESSGGDAAADVASADTEQSAAGDADADVAAMEPVVDTGVSDDDIDAAEGVRSAGMQLPEEPANSDDYAGAWQEFEKADRRGA